MQLRILFWVKIITKVFKVASIRQAWDPYDVLFGLYRSEAI